MREPATATPPPGASAGPRPLPTLLGSALRVFDLSVGQMLWSRRTVFMVLVVGLPVIVALVLRSLVELGAPIPRIGRAQLTGPVVFGLMIWAFFIRFGVPVLAIFYGTSLLADEIEDRTLTYLFTRPIPRGAVMLGKYLAYLVCTISVVLPSVVLVWLLVAPVGASLGQTFLALVEDLGILAAGLAAYGALFAFVGARLKRPLLFGLLFVFGWEGFVLALPGYFKQLTVAHYLQGLVPHAMPAGTTLGALQAVLTRLPGVGESLVGLAVITIGGLWLAMRTASSREYVLEQ